jgi:tricorn protease
MRRTRHAFAVILMASFFAAAARTQEPIRFGRTPDISPDGKLIAFSYLGDIWTVETIGGIARPVTMHEAHDFGPVFSPDGRMLAFSSNRYGSYDVFVVPVQGGRPRRLTFDSAADLVNAWSPDGKEILFASTRSIDYPPSFELYAVPVEGGRVRQITTGEGREGVFSPAGDRLTYVRGPGTWYRKGYHGSANDDIWVCKVDGTQNRQLTTFDGQDSSPMWSADGRFIYYVSECCSTPENLMPANIVRQEVDGNGRPQQVTFHKEDAVRRARISANGEWIVYECGQDLWVLSLKDGNPRKLAIEVHADDKTNTERLATFTQGASEFALSADEKHVAFVVHGEIFVMPIAGGKATRLTDSPAYDHGIAWSPDSRQIIFASDRNGREDLYRLESDDPEHRELSRAHKFKVKQLTDTPEEELGASYSPDGRRVAFLRGGKLWSMKPDGLDQKVVVDDVQVFDYDWSPDSKWIVYARQDGSFASELYITPAEGLRPGVKAKNITRYATYNGGVTWSTSGGKLAFISQRRQEPTMYVLSLKKPAAPGVFEGRAIEIDWDDIHLRVKQPTALPAEEGAISSDGRKVAFRSISSNGDDLWVANSDGGQLLRLTTGRLRPQHIQWSRRTPDLIYFRDGHGSLRTARASMPGEPSVIPFTAKMTIRRDEEFTEMFDQSWHALRENFYDPLFHGANWDAIRAKYRPLVKHVALKEDLYALISLMVGELNASHLGIGSPFAFPHQETAELGLLFDPAYRGPGLRIAEVLKRGPADRRGIGLKAGDLIRSIDRVELSPRTNLSELLNDKVGETVLLDVSSDPAANPKDPKAWHHVEIQATGRDQVAALMYDRWVDRNTQRVAELSKGKLGYIHIPSMDDDGLDRFLRALYSDNYDKEAIVLDVRYNGGGYTHDQILNYLGAREHTIFRQRDGGAGAVLRPYDRKWSRPLVLLINNRSYSDAEIFPSAFRTLGLGKLVGQPTGGHVIGTSTVRLIDGSTFRVPRTGVFTTEGINMEKQGVSPDILIGQHPDDLARGRDKQLDKAVEVLQETVVEWTKAHRRIAAKPSEGQPPVTVVGQKPAIGPKVK